MSDLLYGPLHSSRSSTQTAIVIRYEEYSCYLLKTRAGRLEGKVGRHLSKVSRSSDGYTLAVE